MLPTVHEGDEDHVLPRLGVVRRQRFEPLRDGVHLPSVVAAPLIVKLDDGELVRRAFHEAMKRLMLLVGHDPNGLPGLNWRQTLQTVIHDGASPRASAMTFACTRGSKNYVTISRRPRLAK